MKHRIFFGLPIPSQLAAHLPTVMADIDRLGVPVIWEPPEKLHLTLNFIGAVPGEGIPPLQRLLKTTVSSHQPFNLKYAYLQTLYQRHDSSLIYLAPSGELSSLTALQADLAAGLDALKYPQPRRFFPHLTLGRLKKADPNSIKDWLSNIEALNFTPWPEYSVTQIVLYESLLSKAGSRYLQLFHQPLASS